MYHVLVVEDDDDVREATIMIINQDEGCRGRITAHGVASGAEALEFLRAHPAAAVITDLRMPQMSGIELAKAVKRGWPKTPVVVITGFTDDATIQEARRAGVDDFLRKPVDFTRLVKVLKRFFPSAC